jgi:hypothetical protein
MVRKWSTVPISLSYTTPHTQTARCARPFDLCPQAAAVLPWAAAAAPGTLRVVPWEHSASQLAAPVFVAYRNGEQKNTSAVVLR